MIYEVNLKSNNLGLKRPFELELSDYKTGNKLLTGTLYDSRKDMEKHSYETDKLSAKLGDVSFRLWFARFYNTMSILKSNELAGEVSDEALHTKSVADGNVEISDELVETLKWLRNHGSEFEALCPIPVQSVVIEVDEHSELNKVLNEIGYKKIYTLYGEGAKMNFNFYIAHFI